MLFFFPPIYLFVCVFVCACAPMILSSEQSSGNVWVTHEEMENLASSTKAVSTIWAVSPFLHHPCTRQPLDTTHITLSHPSHTLLTKLTTVTHWTSLRQSINLNTLINVLFSLLVQLIFCVCVVACPVMVCAPVCVRL